MVQGEHLHREFPVRIPTQGIRPVLIAGPCSAESRDQVLDVAKRLKAGGQASFFRAGLWKPRTRPNAFEGLGEAALPWLMEAEQTTGLQAITEVANPSHVEAVLKAGMKAVWIGARTTVSPFAVQALADALRGTDILVLVKNPMHADLKLWAGAIERFVQSCNGQVGALHRGFSSYGSREFRMPPCGDPHCTAQKCLISRCFATHPTLQGVGNCWPTWLNAPCNSAWKGSCSNPTPIRTTR